MRLALIALVILVACTRSPGTVCAPGASHACACPDGRQGAQRCKDDGAGLQPCVCESASPTTAQPVQAPAPSPTAAAPTPALAAAAAPIVSFVTTLGPLDHYNGKGAELMSAAAVIRQDRFRVHTGRPDPGDEQDATYGDDKQRAELEQRLQGAIAADVAKTIRERNPKVKVSLFNDRAEVAVLDPGSDEAACVISRGQVAGNAWNVEAGEAKLPWRMSNLGWKATVTGEAVDLLDPAGKRVVTFGSGAEVLDARCMTTHGVHIGSTLKDARTDSDFAADACTCQPSKDNEAVIISEQDPRNGGVTYLYATCRLPIRCPGEGELPPCAGDWGRDDCVIHKIQLNLPPGA